MANPSRDKGSRLERELVKIFQHHGLDAKRTPMSGAIPGWEGDVIVKIGDRKERAECKSRKSMKQIYKWLGDNYLLCLKQDFGEPLLLMRANDLAALIATRQDETPLA